MNFFMWEGIGCRPRFANTRDGVFAAVVRRLFLVWLTITPLVSAVGNSSLVGPATVCVGTTNFFFVTTDATNGIYAWSVGTNNSAGAVLIGDTNTVSVGVLVAGSGEFTLDCLVDIGATNELATTNVLVPALISGSGLTNQLACAGDIVVFAVTVAGGPSYSVLWRKDGDVLAGATTETLTLTNVAVADAGTYCVEVTGPCNSFTNCVTLDLMPLAGLSCPTNLLLPCPVDIPPPDTNSVVTTNAVAVLFLGDLAATNGCEITITRSYGAVNSCGSTSTCVQLIIVQDTTPPSLTGGTNRTVQCGDPWDFDAPVASDLCSTSNNILVSVLTTVTNPICSGSFWAERTWLAVDECGNSNTCSQIITNLDTTPPVLAGGTNRAVECGSVWDFDQPVALDVCEGTNVTVVILDTVTNATCGNTFVATRTWQAADSCTNVATCSQTIAVVDTTPPVWSGATNRTVECGDTWDFDVPTADDVCSGTNVVVELVSTVTNQLVGETFAAARTWQATDACTNTSTYSQTITLVDLTPPVIQCPSNIVVECAGPPGTQVLFNPVAFDTCDTNVTLVSVPPSGTFFVLGTNVVICTATDDSGNSNQCSFTVTVVDTTPPQISCPSNMIVAEAPRDSGGAVVTFAPTAGDICDSVPALVSEPASGTNFPLGYTTVQNIATDGSGNTNACSFVIRVIPYRLYVLNTNDTGPGSLREALLDANDSPDANLVLFNLPGAGVQTIQPLAPLPPITSPVTIDGWSQPGFSNAPLIEITGSLAGTNVIGLDLVAGSNTVRGLVLNGFTMAILIETNGGNLIQGNYIGTGPTGTTAVPNSGDGIRIGSGSNLIGGYSGGGNLIAFNGGNGVALTGAAGSNNAIVGNSIHSNGGLGIDLGSDGPTPNDQNDFDSGANRLQNFPVLADATSDGGFTVVSGTLNSTPNRTYRIEFFLNDFTNASGFGEGRTFIGSLDQFVQSDGNGDFAVPIPVAAAFNQFVTATATDPNGNTSEFSPPVPVHTPPVLGSQPTNTVFYSGSNVTLCVTAAGTPPILYQWRLNGQNIPDATNACYIVPAAQTTNSGSYVCVIVNGIGLTTTTPATWLVSLPNLAPGDNFVDRVKLEWSDGIVAGANRSATREPGEPLHAGKPGGKSVWYKWIAPSTGITTMGTVGSDFDTLLAVYRLASANVAVTNLVAVGGDEDRGGYFTSGLQFNAVKNQEYQIAIDGFSGESGDFALQWEHERTTYLLPVIRTNPVSQTVVPGTNAQFFVVAVSVCSNGEEDCQKRSHYPGGRIPAIDYQWHFNGVDLPGETNAQLTVYGVNEHSVGNYQVKVHVLNRGVESEVASLQINVTDGDSQTVQVFDKIQDALNSTPLQLGVGAQPDGLISAQASVVVAGYSGSQVFNTVAGTSQGEVFCGVIGGSSEWLNFVPGASGVLSLNTDGSSFDTLLAVLQSNLPPVLLGCDNNSGLGGTNSALVVPVVAGKNYLIGVDGVNGKFGRVVLNYTLNPSAPAGAPQISNFGTTNGAVKFRINSITNKFVVQVSSNLSAWIPLSTNPAPVYLYDFVDWRSTNFLRRYYRVQVVP